MEQPASPITFGKYELLERIAIGGMAEVFRARLLGEGGFEKHLVIKRILPHLSTDSEFVHMLIDEAKIAGCLYHPNIIQIYDLGKINGNYFIAMEFIEGGDLKVVLQRCRELKVELPIGHAVFITTEVLKGLEYAHQKTAPAKDSPLHLQIIHRDVSPPNILISYEGEVKILDFGIAKAATRAMETSAGILKGKFEYMSPEQASGLALDSRTDLFSAGLILYEMVTGQNPFFGQTDIQVLKDVRSGRIPPPSHIKPGLPERLEQIIMRSLARDPEDRYQRAAEMRTDLMSFAYEQGFVSTASKLTGFMHELFEADVQAGRSASSSTSSGSPYLPAEASSDAADRPDLDETNLHLETISDEAAAVTYRSQGPDHAPDSPDDAPTIALGGTETEVGEARPAAPAAHSHESSLSTASAINLLQDYLEPPSSLRPSASGSVARTDLEPPPVAFSFFHGSGYSSAPRPVQLAYGFEDVEEAVTTIQRIPDPPDEDHARMGNLAARPSSPFPFQPVIPQAYPVPIPAAEFQEDEDPPLMAHVRLPEPGAPVPAWIDLGTSAVGESGSRPSTWRAAPALSPADPRVAERRDANRLEPALAPDMPDPPRSATGTAADPATDLLRIPEDIPTRLVVEGKPVSAAFTSPGAPVASVQYTTPAAALPPMPSSGSLPRSGATPASSDSAYASTTLPRSGATPASSDSAYASTTPGGRFEPPTSTPSTPGQGHTVSASAPPRRAPGRGLAYFTGFLAGLLPGLLAAIYISAHSAPPVHPVPQPLPVSTLPARVTVQAEEGVETYLNGNPMGTHYPLTLSVTPHREHRIRLVKPGSRDFETPVRMSANESLVLAVPFLPPAPLPTPEPEDEP